MILDVLSPFWYWFIPTLCFLISSLCIVVLVRRSLKMQKGLTFYLTCVVISFSLFSLFLLAPYVFSVFTTELIVSTSDPANMQMIALSNPLLLEGLKRVDMIPPPHFSLQKFSPNSAGNYNPSDRRIFIDAHSLSVWTWWHELGHHVWFILMTTEEKQAWIAHYEKQRAVYADGFYPTMYAKKNVREDFAESFMLYVGYNELRGSMLHPDLPTGLDVERRYMLEQVIQRLTDCEPVTRLCYYDYDE